MSDSLITLQTTDAVEILAFRDRTGWPKGPWEKEPDRIFWRDKETGYPCLMLRNPFGSWCGYVAVPPGHPAYGKDDEALDLSVHGGITYADFCQEGKEGTGICHTPLAGEPEKVWWLGFDTGHAYDLSPRLIMLDRMLDRGLGLMIPPEMEYRDQEYVQEEVSSLARQLEMMEG